jgi:hypothetical protein
MKNLLLITGSALCTLEDINAVMSARLIECDYMAIGLDAVDKYPHHIKYFATYHSEDILPAKERRRAIGGNDDYLVISHEAKDTVGMVVPYKPPSGSSALLGVQAAIILGYDKIVLCGCPLIGKSPKNNKYEDFHQGWEATDKGILSKVRSMSGWTRELLGEPTEEWLREK